jgi:SAM-dependent methyltransferase
MFGIKKITRRNLDIFLEKYKTDNPVLDVGAGGSSYDRYFPNRIMVDIDPKRNPDIVADAHELPFPNESYGTVLCTEMLEHVKDPRRVVRELMRVLKPRGVLILTTRFVYPMHDTPHDYWRFTRYCLEDLFKDWKIVEIQGETECFSALGALFQRLAFQSTLVGGKLTKFIILFMAEILSLLDFLLVKEYGNIQKNKPEDHIMTTGWYLVVEKSKDV